MSSSLLSSPITDDGNKRTACEAKNVSAHPTLVTIRGDSAEDPGESPKLPRRRALRDTCWCVSMTRERRSLIFFAPRGVREPAVVVIALQTPSEGTHIDGFQTTNHFSKIQFIGNQIYPLALFLSVLCFLLSVPRRNIVRHRNSVLECGIVDWCKCLLLEGQQTTPHWQVQVLLVIPCKPIVLINSVNWYE